MTLKKKLLLALSLLAILPMLVSVTVSTWVAGDSATRLLVQQAKQQLATTRDTKKQNIRTILANVLERHDLTADARTSRAHRI